MIPYASRTVDIILHPDCPLPKKGAKDVINLLKTRELSSNIEAVVQISPERYRLTFKHARQMLAFSNQDFLIHGKPVEFQSVSPFTWVYISRLSYGIPDEAITAALAPYSGGIKSIKSVAHENIYTGEHNVLMKITANIPARLRISGHWCVIKYRGQTPVCFKCHKEGHVIADCPTYQTTRSQHPEQGPSINNNTDTNAANGSNLNNQDVNHSVPVAPSRPPVTYAAVAGRNLSTPTPPESADGSSTPLTRTSTQSAPDRASGAPASSAPSGGGSTANPASTQPSSPIRRRGKRRHSPNNSPQPEEKRPTHAEAEILADDDVNAHLEQDSIYEECSWSGISTEQSLERAVIAPITEQDDTASRPETIPLPQDDDDHDDSDEGNESDMDNEDNETTDKDDDDVTGHGHNLRTNPNNDDDEDDKDLGGSDEDQLDPEDYFQEDDYPSDDTASFATVSEIEMPHSPVPQQVTLTTTAHLTNIPTQNEPACAVAHEADALFKLAAVLPTQGSSSSQS